MTGVVADKMDQQVNENAISDVYMYVYRYISYNA